MQQKKPLSFRRHIAFALVFAALSSAHADYFDWLGSVDTSFENPLNWHAWGGSTGIPGPSDVARFYWYNVQPGATTVTLGSDITTGDLYTYGMSLDLGGHTYTTTPNPSASVYGQFQTYSSTLSNGNIIADSFNLYLDPSLDPSFQANHLNNVAITTWSTSVDPNSVTQFSGSSLTAKSNLYSGWDQTGTRIDLLNGSSLSVLNSATWNGALSIDATSSASFDYPYADIYASSLDFHNGSIDVSGTLTTHGVTLGTVQTGLPMGDASVTVHQGGTWSDPTEAVVSIGFGSKGALTVDGGQATFATELRVGEGNYTSTDGITYVPYDGQGTVTVENGGHLTAKSITLGGSYRYGDPYTNAPLGSGTGSLNVTSGGTVDADNLTAIDQPGTGRSVATVLVDNGTLNTKSIYMTATSTASALSSFTVTNGGLASTTYSASFIGDGTAGPQVSVSGAGSELRATSLYLGAGTNLNVDNGGTVTSNYLRVENASVAVNNSTVHVIPDSNGSANISTKNGQITLSNSTITSDPSTFTSLYAEGKNAKLILNGTNFNGQGSYILADGATGELKNGSFIFQDSPTVSRAWLSFGALAGETFTAENATIEGYMVRFGNLAGDSSYSKLVNSSLTARRTEFNAVSPAGIVIGNQGAGTVEMWSSSLNATKIYIGPQGVLKGDGSLNGIDLGSGTVPTSVVNDGTISPGHSPGHLTVNGDLTNNGILYMEIDLSNPSSYDSISVSNTLYLGGTLELVALGSGTFDPLKHYNLFSAGLLTGSFQNYIIDPKFGFNSSEFSIIGGNFGINPVPEPASMCTLALGVLAVIRRRRKQA